MTAEERIRRIREVERATDKLRRGGWRVESITHKDEDGSPFRTTIELACEGKSSLSPGTI